MTRSDLATSLRDPRLALGIAVFVGYFVAARVARNIYPLSTFPMYSEGTVRAAARGMVRTSAGTYAEVTAFDQWRCESLPVLETTSCAETSAIPYIAREQEQYIRAHQGVGGSAVELVQRVFSFDGTPRPAHCVIARCTAVRR
ncbi:MAG: hypothetical protein ACXVEF_41355 [Polyangiales bacterium]